MQQTRDPVRIARLDTDRVSLVLVCVGTHVPRLLHFGGRLPDGLDVPSLRRVLTAPALSSVPDPQPLFDEPPALSMFPEHGAGFFGQPALLGSRRGRDFATVFELTALEDDGHTLTLVMDDEVAALSLRIILAIDPDSDVLTARTQLENRGREAYDVEWLAALALSLPERFTEVMTLGGRWASEFRTDRYQIARPCQIERVSRYGRTGHGSNPSIFIGEAGFGEMAGEVTGLHLGWSGNHRVLVEVRRDGSRHAQLGEWYLPGEVSIAPGETLTTPSVFATWSDEGLSGLSARFHRHVRGTLLPDRMADRPRPVVLNTWEAVYFDQDVPTLKAIADGAAAIGVERFVLDDGWFEGRDDANTSLGDWTVDGRKFPHGLSPIIDHVNGLGMAFGLWVEPEMVSPDSALYAAHPEWAMHVEGRARPTHRQQLVLDLTIEAVANTIFEALDSLLTQYNIAFLKWDHNRDLAPAASAGVPVARRQTLAFYALVDRLRAAHPSVEIESCASGGARIDYGVMTRAERFWPSDNNDAVERVGIQRGVSLLFPLEVIGAHIGAVPSHQTGRSPSLCFRARIALFGHFGLELDPRHLTAREVEEVSAHVAVYKRYRSLLHTGRLIRFDLGDPGGGGQIVVTEDGSEALAQLVRLDQAPFAHSPPVRLPGLESNARYRLTLVEPWPQPAASYLANERAWRDQPVVDGEALMRIGLRLPLALPETAWLLHLQRL
ncbi:MAG: alpha-galactosidase [Pseudomonadota bacterium]